MHHVSDVLQWTPSHRRTSVGKPARTYQQQLCTDTGCSLEDLPETTDDRRMARERERERELGKSMQPALYDDDDLYLFSSSTFLFKKFFVRS